MEIYRYVALLRQKEKAFHTQHLMFLTGSEYVLAFVRFNPDDSDSSVPYLIVMNLGPAEAIGVGTDEVIISGVAFKQGRLKLDSKTGSVSDDAEGPVLMNLSDIRLEKGEAAILQLINTRKDEL